MADPVEEPQFDWTDWFDTEPPDDPRSEWSAERKKAAEKLAAEMKDAQNEELSPA